MRVVFSPQYAEPYAGDSIFLAGPTTRNRINGDITKWRRQALSYLQKSAFRGDVFFPEVSPGKTFNYSYEHQLEWESYHLDYASCIMFWVPRHLSELPGFTTNIEWGMWCDSGKVVLGFPEDAPKMKPFRFWARHLGVPVAHNLGDTLDLAIEMSSRRKP